MFKHLNLWGAFYIQNSTLAKAAARFYCEQNAIREHGMLQDGGGGSAGKGLAGKT